MKQTGATPALSQSSSKHLDQKNLLLCIFQASYFHLNAQRGLRTRLQQLCLMMEDFKMLSEDETVKLLAEKELAQKCQLLFKELLH